MEREKIVVTGGCGFIGVNFCKKAIKSGYQIIVIDDLSRKGAGKNKEVLENLGCDILTKSIQEPGLCYLLRHEIESKNPPRAILHLAAQTAVTTSCIRPLQDFNNNVLGTINILEALRINKFRGLFINIASNKVYGDFNLELEEQETRYSVRRENFRGITENYRLSGRTPYGCSKLSADQYTIDYAKIFNLNAISLRQSCIYGENQAGSFDQGWISHFVKQSIKGELLTICGNGKQVRDVLHVSDLVKLYLKLISGCHTSISGQAFNVGGGLDNTLSILETIDLLEKETGKKLKSVKENWRHYDQKYFVSDNSKIESFTGWKPTISPKEGLKRMLKELSS